MTGPERKAGTSGQNVPKSKFRQKSQQEKTAASKLRMERREETLDKARQKLSKQKPLKRPGPVKRTGRAVRRGVHGYVHGKIYEVEQENVGVEAAHHTELAGEATLRGGKRFVKRQVRLHPRRAVLRAERKFVKATADYQYRVTAQEHPEMQGNPVSRYWQEQRLKQQYAKQAREAAKKSAKAAEETAVTTEKLASRAVEFVKRHPVGFILALFVVLLVVGLQSCMSSMTTLGGSAMGAIGASTYTASDADMYGAEAAYCALEAELQNKLDNYESTHDYDEYHYDLDDIGHDPYVLISILSAWHEGAWTLDEVQGTMQMLFDRQYILTEEVVRETRYRTETRTDSYLVVDPETGESYWEIEEYEVEVPYDYFICTVTLENFNLSHLPVYIMGQERLSRYALYMATLGNRPDLFPSSGYVNKYVNGSPLLYDIPREYLNDETFAAIMAEAEKYIGYPYVWGGSSPATSFDCSGYVSWVINHSGWNVGRLGAQGLYNICTPTGDPHPGDLVFFVGTYDTTGVSHVGIYVGDGWMLHCGDPISYTNLNNSYWQAHFYAYGRLP